MKSEYIDVDGKWGIVVCYDLRRMDEYEMRSLMMSLGVHGPILDDAIDTLLYEVNTGMCISSFNLKMSLVFVGNATSEDQWWDTMAHEILDHAKVAICDYYDVSFHGEDSAWLTGYLMRKIVQQIAQPCTDKRKPGHLIW